MGFKELNFKMTFREKWNESVRINNSTLCAGLDPAEYDMGRGEKGLPEGVDKHEWASKYIDAVARHVAAVKPNLQFWKGHGDAEALQNLYDHLSDVLSKNGAVVIDDSKLADIGSTNDAGIYYAAKRADAVTFSPFAGNLEEAVKQAHDRGVGLISMCLMSNPEFAREKRKLVPVKGDDYHRTDIKWIGEQTYVEQYIQLARDAAEFKADGIVIGAPSGKNHITEGEIEVVKKYVGDDMLVLVPGVGAQGGEIKTLFKYFKPKNLIVNVGRDLMFPDGSKSTPLQQARAAEKFNRMINELAPVAR